LLAVDQSRVTVQIIQSPAAAVDIVLIDTPSRRTYPCTPATAHGQYRALQQLLLLFSAGDSKLEKILVGLKRAVDYNVRVRVKNDGSGVETDGVKMSINPFDEIALEEALRIKESGAATEIIVVSIGPTDAQQQLRTGLAMGADRAILVETAKTINPLDRARVFLELVNREQPGLVILGKQAIDDDNNQTGQMLAALWNRPQATFASKLELNGDQATVTREVDAGLETIEVDLPAVVTTDLRLNEPRYVKLPDIMKAKKKPLEQLALADLGIEASPGLKESFFEAPQARQKGTRVKDVAELVGLLKEKGLI
jgi:electron transfer flavoprotein beta subunit